MLGSEQTLLPLSDKFYQLLEDGNYIHKTLEDLLQEGFASITGDSIQFKDQDTFDKIFVSTSTQIPYKTTGEFIFTGDLVLMSNDLDDMTHSPSIDDVYVVHFVEHCGCYGIIRMTEEDVEEHNTQIFYKDVNPELLIHVGSIYAT